MARLCRSSAPTSVAARPRAGSGRLTRSSASSRKALIVYGTIAEADSQREAAQALQRKLAGRWANIALPIKADTDVTDSLLKDCHILLVGRPATNRLAARLGKAFPVEFGSASFTLAGETYAHPLTAIVAAGPSPLAADRSVVIFAGLSAEATWMCPSRFPDHGGAGAEVLLMENDAAIRRAAVPVSAGPHGIVAVP